MTKRKTAPDTSPLTLPEKIAWAIWLIENTSEEVLHQRYSDWYDIADFLRTGVAVHGDRPAMTAYEYITTHRNGREAERALDAFIEAVDYITPNWGKSGSR